MTPTTTESGAWASSTLFALARTVSLRSVAVGLALGCVATAGINAVWSMDGDDPTLIGGWLQGVAPLPAWIVAVGVVLLAAAVRGGISRAGPKDATGVVALLVFAYFLGTAGSEWLRITLPVPPATLLRHPMDAGKWFLQRSFFLLGGVPLLLAYLWVKRSPGWLALRWGRWEVETRVLISGRRLRSWRWYLWVWGLFLILPFTVFIHAQNDFVLLESGRLTVFLVPVIGMCLFNALAEEWIFRGVFFPAVAEVWGWNVALWVQALLFGLLHFGSSPAPLGAVAVLVVTAFLGAYFGKSVRETGGMGWALTAHALADFTFFSAQYVAPPG